MRLFSRKDVAKNPADVAVTGGDCSLHIRTPRGELSLTLPTGVTLEQGSCIPTPAGEASGEELHFRLRISVTRSPDEGREHTETRAASLCSVRLLCAKARTKSFGCYLELAVYFELIGLSHLVI